MVATRIILFVMATTAIINAAPTTEPTVESTTDVAVPLVEYFEVIELVPEIDLIISSEQKEQSTTEQKEQSTTEQKEQSTTEQKEQSTTEQKEQPATEESIHKVAKRSLPFNPSNELLSDFEGGQNEESDLVGRIRVLPSWVGK